MENNDLIKALNEIRQKYGDKALLEKLAHEAGYAAIPPTIDQFLDDEYYAGKFLGKNLYPAWREELRKIFSDPFNCNYLQICATGSIGIGKSSFCLAGMLYDLCRLLHLKDPHKTFKLISSTQIAIAFMNTTLRAADSVLFAQFRDWIKQSPFFQEQMAKVKQKKNSDSIYLPHNIRLISGSRGSHALGRAVISGILSELNFQGEHQKLQAKNQYDTIRRRMESRFSREEGLINPGRLWLDSSKSDETGFLENHIKEAQCDPHSLIVSKAIWEVMGPAGKVKYSGKQFAVFIGDQNRDPLILDGDRSLYDIPADLIIEVPIEYLKSFEQDIYGSLRDLAGISTWSSYKFFAQSQKIRDALTLINPASKAIIELDFNDQNDKLINYIDLSKLVQATDYFIHFDLGLKHDRTGIALTRCIGQKQVSRINEQLESKIANDNDYRTDLILAIAAKPGEEVPLSRLKNFVIDLGRTGIRIAFATADGFQSANLLQDLKQLGIQTEVISVDRTRDAYDLLKNAILEDRWHGPYHEILEQEFLGLLDLGAKGIDHPEGTGKNRSSKDLSDAVAGSVWQCAQKGGVSKSTTALKEYCDAVYAKKIPRHQSINERVAFLRSQHSYY